MNLLQKIQRKLQVLYGRHIRRDRFLLEVSRWFKDKGDQTLRLDYPLNRNSIVFDVGGYHGDFAAAIDKKYGCKIYIFEPVPEFYQGCVARFRGNENIICLNYGLSNADGYLDIHLAENASSFSSPHAKGELQRVEIRSVVECIRQLGINRIDLMKINTEGGEFEVIPAMLDSGDVEKIQYLQVQFHNFVKDAASRRNAIRTQLAQTHTEMWNYEFVWESWKRKSAPVG